MLYQSAKIWYKKSTHFGVIAVCVGVFFMVHPVQNYTVHADCPVHRDRITLAVLELSENEELQQLIQTWWFEKGECGNDRTSKKVKHNHLFDMSAQSALNVLSIRRCRNIIKLRGECGISHNVHQPCAILTIGNDLY